MSQLQRLNDLTPGQAADELVRCCGSSRWVERMVDRRPFQDTGALFAAADEVWQGLEPQDWLEAFAHHPRIGDIDSLRAKFANTRQWASGEQSGVEGADERVLQALSAGNRAYEARFGYIFIVCATGRSASEMLALLEGRLSNDPELELRIAAGEQAKITRIRLEKLLNTRET